MDIFKPLRIEDAVIQANDFGSPPNWHIAHVTWFFHQVLNRYGRDKNIKWSNANEINLSYLNSYYQKFGEILPNLKEEDILDQMDKIPSSIERLLNRKLFHFSMRSCNQMMSEVRNC